MRQVTEEEAKKLTCPVVSRKGDKRVCIATDCMWFSEVGQDARFKEDGTPEMVRIYICAGASGST